LHNRNSADSRHMTSSTGSRHGFVVMLHTSWKCPSHTHARLYTPSPPACTQARRLPARLTSGETGAATGRSPPALTRHSCPRGPSLLHFAVIAGRQCPTTQLFGCRCRTGCWLPSPNPHTVLPTAPCCCCRCRLHSAIAWCSRHKLQP
jgi:hypothetical protein